jgi:hypothetical protein
MAQIISIDDVLFDQIKKIKIKLLEVGCKNPSYSNAIRSMLDLPHISGKGNHDICGSTKTVRNLKIPEGSNGKELES